MSIKKVINPNGETKWEVRIYESGRGSKRTRRLFDRKGDADDFAQEIKQEAIKKTKDPFAGISLKDRNFSQEANFWFEDGKMRFSASHQKRVVGILNDLLPRIGEFSIDRFTPDFLVKVQQEQKMKGLKNASINRMTEVISAILNFSTKQRRIPYNPSTGFRKLKGGSGEMAFWNEAEAISFLSHMSDLYPKHSEKRWIYVAYLMALNTAMRAGEIWGLKVSDLKFSKDSIWIRRQFNRVTLDLTPTKGRGDSRHVPRSKELSEEIEDLIKRFNLKDDDLVFRNKEGQAVCHDNFAKRQFGKDLKAWAGREIRFHDLRHTATTLMIASGVDVKTVKEICGHADITTTMNYVHLLSGSVGNVSKVFSLSAKLKEGGEGQKLTLVR